MSVQHTRLHGRISAASRRAASILAVASVVFGAVLLTSASAPAFALPTITDTATGTLLVAATANPIALTTPTSTSAYTSVITPDSRYIYTADQTTDTIYVVDSTTDTEVAQIGVPAGTKIESSAISPDGSHAYFAGYLTHLVQVVDTATNTLGTPIDVVSNPNAVAVSPDGSLLYVVGGGTLTSYNLPGGTVHGTAALGVSSSTSVVITPDGKTAYVSDGGAAHDINVVNTVTEALGTPIVAGSDPYALAISPNGSTVYVVDGGDNSIQAIATATNTIGSPVDTGAASGNNVVRVSPDGKYVYAAAGNGTIEVFPADLSSVVPVNDPGTKYGLVASPDGKRIYAPNLSNGTLDIFNIASLTVTGPAKIAVGTATTSFSISIDDGNTPVGDYSSNTLDVHILNSANAVVATGTGTFDPSTGTATITVPTSALGNGTYSVQAATEDPASGGTVVATATGFVVGTGLAATGVDPTFPLLLGGILVLAGLIAILAVRLARRRSHPHA
jgi:YVTN family beta-propeller protein